MLSLLRGFPQTRLMWRHVAADLASDHTVICPDLRGYGHSDKPADGYSRRTTADPDAGNRLRMPVTVLQQDWGAALGFDAAALWRAWAEDLDHTTVPYGHFMAEEAPDEVAKALSTLLARRGRSGVRPGSSPARTPPP